MFGVLICFLVLESTELGSQTKCLLQLSNLSLEVNEEGEHDDDVENLTRCCLWTNISKAYDSHGYDNVIEHVVVAINGNSLPVIFIPLMRRVILSLKIFFPHRLVKCHVLNGEHASSEQEDNDDEGECYLERDSYH